MRCPTLKELPPPPPGKTGWPWTEESPQLPDTMPDGRTWPKVTIVTPSYNQGQFIEETIRSVLLQGYPNLEYIIIDGGSTDGSVEVIRKYEKWLTYWVSEPDRGQSDAINKGFAMAKGEILAWLNSDDLYTPGAVAEVGRAYADNPGFIVAGAVVEFDSRTGREIRTVMPRGMSFENMVEIWKRRFRWHQPGVFFPRSAYEQVGGMDISLEYAMDFDIICRLLRICQVTYIEKVLARFRHHPSSKTDSQFLQQILEVRMVLRRFWHLLPDGRPGKLKWLAAWDLFRFAASQLLRYRRPKNAFGLLIEGIKFIIPLRKWNTS